jgi:hypothetical protein
LKLKEQYIESMGEILKNTKTVALPTSNNSAGGSGNMDAGQLGAMFGLYKGLFDGHSAKSVGGNSEGYAKAMLSEKIDDLEQRMDSKRQEAGEKN